ncbi:Ig-like domain-containing protein [Comamonas sp. MYb21]|uniref:Ig-like domain-containing protein n=1 Tax=Comamonas sp. MYb21 TaxID=1848648 RepID=UPI0030A7103B
MRPQNVNSSTASSYWRDLAQDHTYELTGATDGALMVLNAGSGLDSFYERNFDVQPGGSYRISVWRYTVNNNLGNGQPIAWSLRLQEVNSGTDIINSGNINSQARFVWEESVYEFSIPPTCTPPAGGIQTKLSLRNESPVTNGNDIYIDDISVTQIAYDPALPSACPQERSAVVADADSASTPFNTPVTLSVKGNDSTSAGVLSNPAITTPPTQGEALVNPDGTITYTPPAGFSGEVTFEYEICNGETPQACDKAVVTVTVEAQLPVVADDDSATTKANTSVNIDVKVNDSTPVGVLGNPTIVSQPANGEAIVNPDGTIIYTPPAGFTGVVTFEYEICNGETPQACDTAVVTVTVTDEPVPPPGQAATPVPTMGFGALAALSAVIGAVGISRRRKKTS